MDDSAPKLLPADELFISAYLVDFCATRAYRIAFPDKASTHHRNCAYYYLNKPHIKQEIANRLSETLLSLGITAENTLREIARNAFADPRKFFNKDGTLKPLTELSADDAAAIAQFEVEESGHVEMQADLINGGEEPVVKNVNVKVKKLKLNDRYKYLELLVKYQQLIKEKLEVTGANGEPLQVSVKFVKAKPQEDDAT